jgi:hypothetical protein
MSSGAVPFTAQAPTMAISATASASTSAALPIAGSTLRIVNEGPNIAFIHVTSGTAVATLPTGTAAASATPCPVGDISLTIPDSPSTPLNISAICRASQTAALSVQVGDGI